MSSDQPPTDDFDRERFEAELSDLVDHARSARIDVEGGYDVRVPQNDRADYTIEISRTASSLS